jgi:beta-N-acetylhexosaminidase
MTTVPFTARKVSPRAAAVLAAATLASCGGGGGGGARIEATGPLPPPPQPSLGLPLETAVAQLFAVGFPGTGPGAPILKQLRGRDWGAVVLGPSNLQAPLQARVLAKSLRSAGARGGRPAPLVLASSPETFPGVQVDAEPDLSEPAVAFRQARAAAGTLRATGVRAGLAPDADLAVAAGPASDRAYSAEAGTAARLVQAAERGWRAGGVAPVVGHFPGEGGASRDPEQGAATVGLSLDELRKSDVLPFATVAGEAPAMQLSNATYVAWDGVTPASLEPEAYRLLRRTGFEGAAVTGNLATATLATGGSVARAALDALRAGADLVYISGDAADQDAAYRAVLEAARTGRLPRERLADALLHVAALKRGWAS